MHVREFFLSERNRYPNGVHPDAVNAIAPPQIPPRAPGTQRSNVGYGNFSQGSYPPNPAMYNSYSNPSSYFGSYQSPYGTGLLGSTGYGGISNNSNSFLRAAEENSRGAFQSIESVVGAFTAVAAMFESTYFAVYNSFRAVVGVADQFYRLKTQLSSILSAFALVRFFKYLIKKLMRFLRLARSGNVDLSSII